MNNFKKESFQKTLDEKISVCESARNEMIKVIPLSSQELKLPAIEAFANAVISTLKELKEIALYEEDSDQHG